MKGVITTLPELPQTLKSALDGLLDPDVPRERQGAKSYDNYSFIIKNGWNVTFTFMGARERVFRKPIPQWGISFSKELDSYVDSKHLYEDDAASCKRLREWAEEHASWDGAW